ncbi:MAG: DUF6531 domain-containing protein [Thermoanaerobaculia bacterium]|nr:DUF6531 domain-containing protein [Thermoanaerobaculia bacterium]
MRIAGTSPAGLTIDPAGLDAELPRPELAGEADGLRFTRLSDRLWEEGSSVFLSEEVAIVADLRAARAYERTGRENDPLVAGYCVRCDRAALAIDLEARELLSGDEVRVTFEGALGQRLTDLYGPARLATSELALPSVRWETAPSLRQEPTLGPSLGGGEVVPGTLLHSGEFRHDATDLYVPGRGLDFAFSRTYRNQTVGGGPLGPGWDFAYRMRLRELPSGDVELYDGGGRRETFRKVGTAWEAPPGRFVDFEKTAAGWRLTDPSHSVITFDAHGLLASIADPVRQSESSGNEIRFTHDARGRLTLVTDPLGRRYELGYTEDGRLESVTDFTGREVLYGYDPEGRLDRVTSPRVELGVAKFPNGLVTRYDYAPAAGSLAARLATRDNLLALVDARGQVPVELVFEDLDADGRSDEVATETWGGHDLSIAYDFSGRTTTVTDRRGFPWITRHNAAGQVVSTTDPFPATTQYEVDGEGLVTKVIAPLGRQTVITYDANGERRARGNALSTVVTADGRGPNGSSPSLTTTVEYDPYSNQPVRLVDPRGAVTEIERDGRGLATKITEAFGTPEAGRTLYQYDDFGRPVQVTNANDHVTTYAYHESGASRGYLRETVVDPGGLAIATRYETDGRGNVTAVTDPRGVRHLTRYNELDWPFESVQAATAATDGSGAPALGYTTTLVHDANGNVIEQRIPYGEHGETFTRVITDYGILNETRTVAREIEPGGEQALEHLAYDVNFNLEQTAGAEGQVTRYLFDSRSLLATVTRGFGTPEAATESYGYDAEAVRTSFTNGRGRTFRTHYDGFGRYRESIDPLGNRTTTRYDDAGNSVETESFDSMGSSLARSGADFDLRHRPTTSRAWLWSDDPSTTRSIESTIAYDPVGNVISTTDPGGRTTSFEFDAAERPVLTTDSIGNEFRSAFDAAGNVRSRTLVEGPPGERLETTISTDFDAASRPVRLRDPLGNISQQAFDARSNVVRAMDPEGYLTVSEFDGLGRRTRSVRPEGIAVDFTYDRSSRLRTYRDGLGNETTWSYDALNRKRTTTYPDGTAESISYDAATNPILITDAAGNTVVQGFDDGNRITSRAVSLADGFEGPTTESFEYDGLGRLKRAVAGDVESAQTFDSLSRLTSETTSGRTVLYEPDDLGNVARVSYPSGLVVERIHDDLNRLSSIDGVVQFQYRGPDLVSSRELASGPDIAFGFDAARRMVSASVTGSHGIPFEETLAWSPRGLKVAAENSNLGGSGTLIRHDGAGRVVEVAEVANPAALVENNSTPASELFEAAVDSHGFSYDQAQNIRSRTDETGGLVSLVEMQSDDSGRNRPASLGSTPLGWDANGNLVEKGGIRYHYDYRNRLTRITGASGGEVASYTYDAFNRRISKSVGGSSEGAVWGNWQNLETYRDGILASRRTFGVGLDEVVRQETDLDGDGDPEAKQTPIYDSTGSLVAVASADGKPIERYDYAPFGRRTIHVDLVPPRVEQVRSVGDEVWIETTERVNGLRLRDLVATGELKIENLTNGLTVEIEEFDQPVGVGRQARRRFVLRLAEPPPIGDLVRLVIPVEALEDDFLNRNSESITPEWSWSGLDEVIVDERDPHIEEIRIRGERVEIEWSEEVNPLSANERIRIDGEPAEWELLEDRYTLRATLEVSPLAHVVEILPGVADLSGRLHTEALNVAFPSGSADRLGYRATDPTLVPISTLGNRLGFHGAQVDDESGLVYFRNRYYDPELGRFLTDDPNLYADSGNPGQFALNNPLDLSDPMGAQVLGWASARSTRGMGHAGRADFSLFNASGQPADWSFVQSSPDRLVTFLHGYNVDEGSFTGATGWLENVNAGFVRAGREQPIYGFTWKGDPLGEGWSVPFFGFAEANADVAGVAFAKYLGGVRAAGGAGLDHFVVTHSLGARVALRGLQNVAAWRKSLQATEFGQTHYSQDLDGLFTLNAAVTRRSVQPGGFLESALDAVAYFGNFHSREDPVLGGVFNKRKFGRALGSGEIRGRVGSTYADRVGDFDMMDPWIAGSPACTHSNHLRPLGEKNAKNAWPYVLAGQVTRDRACYGAGFEHRQLFETLGAQFNLHGRGSKR